MIDTTIIMHQSKHVLKAFIYCNLTGLCYEITHNRINHRNIMIKKVHKIFL